MVDTFYQRYRARLQEQAEQREADLQAQYGGPIHGPEQPEWLTMNINMDNVGGRNEVEYSSSFVCNDVMHRNEWRETGGWDEPWLMHVRVVDRSEAHAVMQEVWKYYPDVEGYLEDGTEYIGGEEHEG